LYEVDSVRKMQFRIAWPAHASDASIAAQQFIGQGKGSVDIHKGTEIIVTFELPPASARQNVVGEVWVNWTFPRDRRAPPVAVLDKLDKRAWRDEPAAAFRRGFGSMNSSQQNRWISGLRSKAVAHPVPPVPPAPRPGTLVRAVPNERAHEDADRAK